MNVKLAFYLEKLLNFIIHPLVFIIDTLTKSLDKIHLKIKESKLEKSTDEKAIKTTVKAIVRDIIKYKPNANDPQVIVIADYVNTPYSGLSSFQDIDTIGIFKNSYEKSLYSKHIKENKELQIKVMEEIKSIKHIDVRELTESEINSFPTSNVSNVIKGYDITFGLQK